MRIPRRIFRDLVCDRGPDTIVVANLSVSLGVFISARTEEVRLERAYAKKIILRHRLSYEDLPVVQSAIEWGYCLESPKPRHLEFVYYDQRNKPYVVIVKSARWGEELWLCTAHRSNRLQAKSKTSRQRVL
jgi:hypothetical protein